MTSFARETSVPNTVLEPFSSRLVLRMDIDFCFILQVKMDDEDVLHHFNLQRCSYVVPSYVKYGKDGCTYHLIFDSDVFASPLRENATGGVGAS